MHARYTRISSFSTTNFGLIVMKNAFCWFMANHRKCYMAFCLGCYVDAVYNFFVSKCYMAFCLGCSVDLVYNFFAE